MRIILFSTLLSLSLFAQNYLIGFAQDTMANDFRKAQVEEVSMALKNKANINFVYTDAKAQTSMLIYQIEDFITKKVDVLIVGTNDENAIVPSLQKAYDANIPVIIVDRGVNTESYTTFINSDNIKMGQIGASFIADKLKNSGTILLLEGLQSADVTKLRTKGFVDEISKHKDIKIIKITANYLRRDAIIEVEKLLNQGVKFDAIFSQSDSMLSGARSALEEHKINFKNLITVGCDYTSEAKIAIQKGTQTGSIKFPLAGSEAAKVALDILKGQKVDKHIVIPVKLITSKNVNDEKPIF